MTNSQALTVHEDEGHELIPAGGWGVDVEAAIVEWEAYQRLTRELLDASDYQKIGNKRFKKKSAWRKYARAFNITDEVTHEEITRRDDGWPVFARIRVRATAPNGRNAEADQEAHLGERCCPGVMGLACGKRNSQYHTCCKPGCDARQHWSHPGDIPAVALTRAKNRAIADLIGAGEVSAEEAEKQEAPPKQRAANRQHEPIEGEYREAPSMDAEAPSKHQVEPPAPKGGWEQFDEARQAQGISVEEVESYTEVRFKKVDVAAWLRERGMTYSGLLSALITRRAAETAEPGDE